MHNSTASTTHETGTNRQDEADATTTPSAPATDAIGVGTETASTTGAAADTGQGSSHADKATTSATASRILVGNRRLIQGIIRG